MDSLIQKTNKLRDQLFIIRAIIRAYYTYAYLILKKYYYKPFNSLPARPSSILHINTFDHGGGAAKIAYELCNYQHTQSLNSAMLVGNKKSDYDFVLEINPEHSRRQHFLTTAQKQLQWQDFFHTSAFKIVNQSIFKKADIVHLHNLHGDYFSPFAIPLLSSQKPTVWTLHDMQAITGHCGSSLDCEKWESGCGQCPYLSSYPALQKDTTHFIWKTKQKIYAKSKLTIVVPSMWLKKKVEKSTLKQFSVHLIYNGIDTTIYRPYNKQQVRDELGIPRDLKVVLFSADMGLNNPYKGGEYVKKIINLHDKSEILFINIGGGTLTEKGNRVWNISYLSDSAQMAKYYSASDLYLYPTLADNCPLVVLEAMACGLPVLSFNTGGIPELVKHMETGYISKYKNIDELNNGLLRILNDTDLRENMGVKAIEIVQKLFTKEIMNQKYLALYNNLLQKG